MRLAKTHITRLLRQSSIVAETYQAGDWVRVVVDRDDCDRACRVLTTQGFDCHAVIVGSHDGRRSMLVAHST